MKALKMANRSYSSFLRKCRSHLISLTEAHSKLGGTELHLLHLLCNQKLPEASDLLLQISSASIVSPVVHFTSLITTFSKIGRVNEARLLFDIMPLRNAVTYNAMLTGYLRCGMLSEGLNLFDEMPERNNVSFTLIISGLLDAARISEALKVFAKMPQRSVVSWNAMISGLIKNNKVKIARKMFDQMLEKNTASWNAMIGGYAERGRMLEAESLFEKMEARNIITWTTMITGYCRIGDVNEAYRLFLKTPEKNVVCWTAMISGFTWNRHYRAAFSLFRQMKTRSQVPPNAETLIAMAYACAGLKLLRLGQALHAHLVITLFEEDGRSSQSLVYMYTSLGLIHYAYRVFCRRPSARSARSYNCLIDGFSRIGMLETARKLFDGSPERDKITWTCIINGHFIAGELLKARQLFDEMPEKDSVAWGTMVSGYIRNRRMSQAEETFHEMRSKGVKALTSTYVAMCCGAGEIACLDKGRKLHCLIVKSGPSDLILNNCLISMYEKCGEVGDAREVFLKTEGRDVVTWNAMIGGLGNHGMAEEALGEYARMKESGVAPNTVTFLGLLSACANVGMVERGCEVFGEMVGRYSIGATAEHCEVVARLLARVGSDVAVERVVRRVVQTNGAARVPECRVVGVFEGYEELRVREELVEDGIVKTPGFSWVV